MVSRMDIIDGNYSSDTLSPTLDDIESFICRYNLYGVLARTEGIDKDIPVAALIGGLLCTDERPQAPVGVAYKFHRQFEAIQALFRYRGVEHLCMDLGLVPQAFDC